VPREVHIDEEDATICGKFVVPFILLIVFTLMVEQYWSAIDFNTQVAFIMVLLLAATFVYRNRIREMIYN
jgi:hypothetical protein